VIFLKKRSNEKGLEYNAGRLKISSQITVDNMRRFVQISGTEDISKRQALYVEVLNSGDSEFFMEACKALVELKFEDQEILQRGLLPHWATLSFPEQEWAKTHILCPLVNLRSHTAIPYLREEARHGGRWDARIDAMKVLIEYLQADGLEDLLLEIGTYDDDVRVRRAAYSNISKVAGNNTGNILMKAMLNAKDEMTRSFLLEELAAIKYPATFDLAKRTLESNSSHYFEKEAACHAFATLADSRAYPLLLKEFNATGDASVFYREAVAEALLAVDYERSHRSSNS
jgi:hypothetical protein